MNKTKRQIGDKFGNPVIAYSTQWTLVRVVNPKKTGNYLTIINSRYKNPSITRYDSKIKHWYTFGKVRAWMPIPKFYKKIK